MGYYYLCFVRPWPGAEVTDHVPFPCTHSPKGRLCLYCGNVTRAKALVTLAPAPDQEQRALVICWGEAAAWLRRVSRKSCPQWCFPEEITESFPLNDTNTRSKTDSVATESIWPISKPLLTVGGGAARWWEV